MKALIETIVFSIVIVTFCAFCAWVVITGYGPKTPEQKIEHIKFRISDLPDSYVKRNLMLSLAGEYGGYSEELFSLLKPFSEMKLKEMEK